MGMVRNVLGHAGQSMFGALTKAEFALSVARGLGGNLPADQHRELAGQVLRWADLRAPSGSDGMDLYLDEQGQLQRYIQAPQPSPF